MKSRDLRKLSSDEKIIGDNVTQSIIEIPNGNVNNCYVNNDVNTFFETSIEDTSVNSNVLNCVVSSVNNSDNSNVYSRYIFPLVF